MVAIRRLTMLFLVLRIVLGSAGIVHAEPLLGQDLLVSDATGLFPILTFQPNSDNFTVNWTDGVAGHPALKINILETPGDNFHAQVTVSGLTNFTFHKVDNVTILDVNDTISPPLTKVTLHNIKNLSLGIPDPTTIDFPSPSPIFNIDTSGLVVNAAGVTSSVTADLTFGQINGVPEPAGLTLLGLGLVGLCCYSRKKKASGAA
jgi:hypothetical protein